MKTKSKMITDRISFSIFLLFAVLAASSIIFIVVFIFNQGIKPFYKDYLLEDGTLGHLSFQTFVTGRVWNYPDYGAVGILINTIYLTLLATIVALPISVLTALFIVRIAPKWLSVIVSNVVELLAAIPSIIFGLFGMGVINPMVKTFAGWFGIQTAGGTSGLSAVIVLIMMILPTITMLTVTSMKAVKNPLIEASLALGASKTQTDFKIVIGGARSGIFAALILGVGRALGEATAVSMVCGTATIGPNFDLFGLTSTLTSTMMMGLHESSGINYDVRLSVGILLIVLILITSLVLNLIKKKMEKVYGN